MKTSQQHESPDSPAVDRDQEPLIELIDIHKSFGDNHVLRGFNLKLYPQENLVILGRSGAGKSVLIKCIVGLMEPDSGTVQVLGQSIPDLEQDELDHIRTEVGFLFQGSALYDSMTVRENLQFPLRRHPERQDGRAEAEKIEQALESVGLAGAIDLMPAELSGGMKRRVALVRTLILDPKIILYDEPTTGLDPITSNEIVQLISRIQREDQTAALIITHDMDCARVIANRIIILEDGVDYAEGTYESLSQSTDPKVSAFFKTKQV